MSLRVLTDAVVVVAVDNMASSIISHFNKPPHRTPSLRYTTHIHDNNNINTHHWNYKAKLEAKAFCQEQWGVFFQSQVMNCHQKRSVTEKQFSAPPSITTSYPYPKVNEKKKVPQQHLTSSVFCSQFWGHLNWQEEDKSVLVSFPSPERKIYPSNRRKTEESYSGWWVWNPSVASRPCTEIQQQWQTHTNRSILARRK